MNIISWNCKGVIKQPEWDLCITKFTNADIIGLYETNMDRDDEYTNKLNGFIHYGIRHTRRSKYGRAPGGISVFVNNTVSEKVVKIKQTDTAICLKIAGEYIGNQKDLLLIFTYIFPEGNLYYVDADEENGMETLYTTVQEIIESNENSHILIAGDLNARVGQRQDFINDDSLKFIMSDPIWYKSDYFDIPRKSKDDTVNNFGKTLIDMCCTYDLHMLNGRAGNDTAGEYTFLSEQGKSVIDYMLVNTELYKLVSSFGIKPLYFSDHLCTAATIKFAAATDNREELNPEKWTRYKLTPGYIDQYQQNLTEPEVQEEINKANHYINMEDINQSIHHLNNALYIAAEKNETDLP